MLRSLVLVVSAAVAAAPLVPGAPRLPTRSGSEHIFARVGDLPHVAPADVGMSAERLAVIDRVVGHAIDAGGFPGAAVIVGRHGAIVWERGYGTLAPRSNATVDPQQTLYDLASLTKVIATSAAAMVLVDQGRLRLDDPVARYLPEFGAGPKSRVTIRQLLNHRSGLPAGRELPRNAVADARRLVLRTPLEATPGEQYEYSDLGPDVLGFVIERVTGQRLDRFLERAVYGPLGMRSTMFRPSGALAARVAPTERGIPRGEVHDRTAYALGGVAGHAGLFATASDLAVFAQFMLERGSYRGVRLVQDSTVALFTRRGPLDRQALGWETCTGSGSCGRLLGPTAFGHTGFTGTSVWVDPERDLFVIVLTNWVAGRDGGRVAPVAVLHDVRSDIADLAALSVTDGTPTAMPDRMRSDVRIGW